MSARLPRCKRPWPTGTSSSESWAGAAWRPCISHKISNHRPVALKVLSPALTASLGADRFLREIELAARLQHPNIVTVFDSGDTDGLFWFTMPYIEGETLRTRLEHERQLLRRLRARLRPLRDARRSDTVRGPQRHAIEVRMDVRAP